MNPPNPRKILRDAGLGPKKAWGQNFLCDQSVLVAIAEATDGGPSVPVVELGAGLGSLTHYLLRRGGRVIAVERDRELVPLLRAALSSTGTGDGRVPGGGIEHLEILEADAAAMDYGQLAERLGARPVVCGNLPYHLSSRILVSVADQAQHVARAVLMVQREVADRLAASPGGRTFGLLSVLVQRAFRVSVVRRVPPGAFLPRPRVTSAVVCLEPLESLLDPSTDRRLVAAARAAFSTRRKTLKNALTRSFSADSETIVTTIVAARIDPSARAERLSVNDFARLGTALANRGLLD